MKPDVLVITESWLSHKCPVNHEEYQVLQSPLANYQGVLILAQKCLNITPAMPDRWSTTLIAYKIKVRDNKWPIVVIGTYI